MTIIERFKKSAREAVTTAEIFVSKYMLDFLGSKLRLVCKALRVATPELRVMYSEESDVTAWTSLDEMRINAGHEMFDGDDEMRLLKISGVLLHEVGHIIFTNFTAWSSWEGSMRQGLYFPSVPDVEAELEDAREKLAELAKDPRYKEPFIRMAHDLSNCLEDGRIENFILRFIKNARFMTKGLVRLRQETYAKMPSFEELQSGVDSGDMNMLGAILQLVIHYARFHEVKGKLDKTSSLGSIITKLIPEIDRYLEAKEAVNCYDSFNKMLIILEDVVEDTFKKMEESSFQEMLNRLSQSLSDHGSGQQDDSSSQAGSSGSQSQEQGSNASADGSEGSGSSGTDSGQSSSDQEPGSNAGSSSRESSGSADDSGSKESGASDGAPSMTDEEVSAALSEALGEALDKLVGTTVDNSGNMSDQATGSDRSSVNRRLSGLANSEGGKVKTESAAKDGSDKGETFHEEAEVESNVGLTLDDIARRIADDAAEEMISSEVESEYGRLASEVKDFSEIHKHRDITMFHYSDVSRADVAAYDEIAKAISPLVKKAVKGSNFYEKDREIIIEDGLFSGQRLHAEQAYRKDGRIFSKTYDHDEPPLVALAVRIDSSGSMNGERIKAAQRACIFLHEYAIGMEKKYNVKIPLYMYGDCVGRSACGVNMYVFADDKYKTPLEKYKIMHLAAGGRNRDGLPIRIAVKRLEEEHPYASKVLFNITDGQPNDDGYGGPPAWDDLRDITRHCEKKRIALASCAIGDDREQIAEIYGGSHFLNISDLDELPVRLVRILKKLLK